MSAQEYAISHWPDADELIAKARRLVNSPPRPIRRDKMREYLDFFERRCGGSKAATLETGAVVQVPLFLNPGDVVKVDTRTGAYVERV